MFKAIQKSKSKKGFTLVELIVVISIIAILLLILVPSLLSYLSRAKETQAEANAKSAYNACVAVYTDLYSQGSAPAVASLPALASTSGLLKIDAGVTITAVAGTPGTATAVSYVTWSDGTNSAQWPQ